LNELSPGEFLDYPSQPKADIDVKNDAGLAIMKSVVQSAAVTVLTAVDARKSYRFAF
jgi:hypothetical protein